MIYDKDRIALIKYRMEQAIDTIDVVDFLINSDKLTVGVNRIYYGLFYSIIALAINNKLRGNENLIRIHHCGVMQFEMVTHL